MSLCTQDFMVPLVITQIPPKCVMITRCLEGKALAPMNSSCPKPFSLALLSGPAGCVSWESSGLPPLSCMGPCRDVNTDKAYPESRNQTLVLRPWHLCRELAASRAGAGCGGRVAAPGNVSFHGFSALKHV